VNARSARAYFAACAALLGFVLAYVLPIYARLPKVIYDPIARRWVWAVSLGPIPMGYVGQCLWGLFGALVGAGVANIVITARGDKPSSTAYGLFAAWVLTAIAIVGGYFTWSNWP
jgi:hypothetical protein